VVQNNIYFNFGSTQDPLNAQTKIDILCTLKITDNKFPNDLQIATLGKSYEEQVGMQVDWLAYQLAMPSEFTALIQPHLLLTTNRRGYQQEGRVELQQQRALQHFAVQVLHRPRLGLRWTGSLISSDIATLATGVSGCDAGDFVTVAVVLGTWRIWIT
jgi:hypothetical protein